MLFATWHVNLNHHRDDVVAVLCTQCNSTSTTRYLCTAGGLKVGMMCGARRSVGVIAGDHGSLPNSTAGHRELSSSSEPHLRG
jgi:hypothetical protein